MTGASAPIEQPTSDCSICRHPAAASIDAGLLDGTALRTLAGTYEVSRSSLHRHKTNHLSVQTITDEPAPERSGGLRLVEIHGRLADLADRLEKVVELATRTRKAPAAVTAMRELRSTLEAISRIQADPELMEAASLDALNRRLDDSVGRAIVRLLDFVLEQFGLPTHDGNPVVAVAERERIVAGLVHDCLLTIHTDGSSARFDAVDVSAVRAYIEWQAVAQAERVEAEVQRRVTAELARREARARPAIEARALLSIEGGEAIWTA